MGPEQRKALTVSSDQRVLKMMGGKGIQCWGRGVGFDHGLVLFSVLFTSCSGLALTGAVSREELL